jgi:hypothetical protein
VNGSSVIAVLGALVLSSSLSAQTTTPPGTPNLSGSWRVPYTPNLADALGKQPPYTAHGAERWRTVDTAKDPTGTCLPPGPSRVLTSPFPFMIVQQQNMIALLFEYQTLWRAIYMDGRKHPADIADYPEFMGHSIGHWDGDTLVVDTVAINERTWLDTAGHEHSAKLHLTERFRKISEDKIEWTATFEDPIFFAKPWSISRTFSKFDDSRDQDRILPYTCTENNLDVKHLVPNQPNLNYKYEPEK